MPFLIKLLILPHQPASKQPVNYSSQSVSDMAQRIMAIWVSKEPSGPNDYGIGHLFGNHKRLIFFQGIPFVLHRIRIINFILYKCLVQPINLATSK